MTRNEWARAIVAPWEHGSEEHRQWLRDIAVPDIEAALKEARLQALLDVRRALIPVSEGGVHEGLIESIEEREDVSYRDVFTLGWSQCFNTINGMTRRLLADLQQEPTR